MVIPQQKYCHMKKILVVGEKSKDVFVYGSVDRICPEAPVPVLKPIATKENPGMAANVFANLEVLSKGLEINGLYQEKEITKTRFVDQKSNQMILRVDEGEETSVEPLELEKLEDLTLQHDVVIISDYNKGFITEEVLVQLTHDFDFSVLDTKRKLTEEVVKNTDFIKLNSQEYQNNIEIVEKYPNKFLITLGAEGVRYNGIVYPSPDPQETIDVSGAGDTFIAAFTIHYIYSRDVAKSILYANRVSANVVNKKGVALPDTIYRLFF
jgi:bifunctional ADP-heptose synthase (sugar kinase/adenylyltransferase)